MKGTIGDMVAIRLLPPDVVNRIAAGEVIERPASVVKELVENAIDAGASRVSIEVEEGGRRLIRVRDDGAGIAREDLPLAFTSHATSKLSLDDDLPSRCLERLGIDSLGFRGEALASIASIAEIEVLTRRPDEDCGYRFRPGSGREPEPTAAPPGTTIEVRNIFFNTPARRKFLRSVSTEQSHVIEHVVRTALGFPAIAFRLRHGSRTVLDLPAAGRLGDRVAAVLGEDKSRDLVEVHAPGCTPGAGDSWLHGFAGRPRLFRADTRGQNFFVNGRWVRDRTLTHALREAYQGLQIPGKHPVVYLFLRLPPDQVDINVHPQKTEVRFVDTRALHRGVVKSVRQALSHSGVLSRSTREDTVERDWNSPRSSSPATERREQEALDIFGSPPDSAPTRRSRDGPRQGAGDPAGLRSGARFRSAPGRVSSSPAAGGGAPGSDPTERARTPSVTTEEFGGVSMPGDGGSGGGARRAFQVLRSFIVTEKGDALVLIDQHALHEKVLYERILRRLRTGSFSSQKLLLPEVVRIPAELVPGIPGLVKQLATFGFEVEPFGETEVAVQAVPAILESRSACGLVLDVATWMRDHPAGPAPGADGVIGGALREIAALMACKQAVKAGMRLDPGEIAALLEESERATDPDFCPHGRPTSVALAHAQLERLFDRR